MLTYYRKWDGVEALELFSTFLENIRNVFKDFFKQTILLLCSQLLRCQGVNFILQLVAKDSKGKTFLPPLPLTFPPTKDQTIIAK